MSITARNPMYYAPFNIQSTRVTKNNATPSAFDVKQSSNTTTKHVSFETSKTSGNTIGTSSSIGTRISENNSSRFPTSKMVSKATNTPSRILFFTQKSPYPQYPIQHLHRHIISQQSIEAFINAILNQRTQQDTTALNKIVANFSSAVRENLSHNSTSLNTMNVSHSRSSSDVSPSGYASKNASSSHLSSHKPSLSEVSYSSASSSSYSSANSSSSDVSSSSTSSSSYSFDSSSSSDVSSSSSSYESSSSSSPAIAVKIKSGKAKTNVKIVREFGSQTPLGASKGEKGTGKNSAYKK